MAPFAHDSHELSALQPASSDTSKPQVLPKGILFDQWSRYASLAGAVRSMLPDGGTVLDVGSGALTLLRHFLPGHEVTFIDPLLLGHEGPGLIGSHFEDGAVADGSFDAVVCVDVLEHVPVASRSAFLERMLRASRCGVIVSAPFADVGRAKEVDDCVQLAYRCKQGRDYPWLAEHEQHGLPDFAATRALFEQHGLSVAVAGNGHVPWLVDLLSLHVVLLDDPVHLPLLRAIGDRFVAELQHFDQLEPVYRQIVVADRRGPVSMPEAPCDPAAAAVAWRGFRAWVHAAVARHADALAESHRQLAATAREREEVSAENAERIVRLQHASAEVARLRHLSELQQATIAQRDASIASLHHSLSWRSTAPLRVLLTAVRSPLRALRHAVLATARWCVRVVVPQRLVWPVKNAFFTLFRPLLRNTREYVEWQEARRWRDGAGEVARATIEPGHDTLPDVLVFGVIGWAFRIQRPQQLALQLARRGHRLFYLAPGFIDSSAVGYRVTRVDPELPLYEVRLHAAGRVSIYAGAPGAKQHGQLAAGLRRLLHDAALGANVAIVDHPGWVDLALLVPRSTVVYDCMDNHHGFEGTGAQLPDDERRLIAAVDALVVTSNHLDALLRPLHGHVRMVRNGCDPGHFAAAAGQARSHARPVIGYFGAMAEWFDVMLVKQAATQLSGCDFLLVGDDTAKVADRLSTLPNVRFTGEIPYAELPPLVAQMDVLFIPFVIDELTLATNPVKAYEALAAGKPVVATAMPELMDTDLAPFVRIGNNATEFVQQLVKAVEDGGDAGQREQRMAFARGKSWQRRAGELMEAVASAPKAKAAVVVVSWNGVALTERCVRSLLDDPLAGELDVIVVDNASSDATPQWLDQIERDARVRVVRNRENLGFAAACNQGLALGAERDPDVLVILNNDIVVTPGWLRTLHNHLRRDPSIGLIGPVTNNIGNEARIETAYRDLLAMQSEQVRLTGAAAGITFEIPVLAFFCVAMPRDVYAEVGGLDANFGTGFFEDDDYCQRVRKLGRRIVCAEDVFVHHELSASFDKIDQAERARLFERNRAYYESKWGPWQRHAYRPRAQRGVDGRPPDSSAAAS